jgi:hypothetical protein
MAIRTLKKSWMLNEECFKKLLEALDPDGLAWLNPRRERR